MDWRDYVRAHLPPLDVRPEREVEIVEELAIQLEGTYERARREGATDEQAEAQATDEVPDWRALADTLGGIEHAPPHRPVAGHHAGGMLTGWANDVRYACRVLAQAPFFLAAALCTLGLGIGAVTIIYSLVDGLLLKPLPIHEPDHVVLARSLTATGDEIAFSWPDFLDVQARAQSFESLAAWRGGPANLTGLGQPRRILVRQVTWNLLRVLGVAPVIGRDFTETDDAWGRERVCLISYRLWQQQFGGDVDVIGRSLMLDDRPVTIIGVLPAGYDVARLEDAYLPFGNFIVPNGPIMFRGNHSGLAAIGRLRPGVTVDEARAEMALIAAQLEQEHPSTNAGQSATAVLLSEVLIRDTRPALALLLGGVAALLLVASVNMANLQLVRAAGRAQELEVRLALGASRGRVVRQLLVESLLVAGGGGLVGVALAFASFDAFVAMLPQGVARVHEVSLNLRVLGVAFAVAAGSGLLFGLVPALQAGRGDHATLLRGARVAHHGGRGQGARRALMAAELALALVLLAAGGLMLRTLANLLDVNPGFEADHVLSASVSLPVSRYPQDRWAAFYQRLEERLRVLPGVRNAAFTNSLPLLPSNWNSVFIVDDRPAPARDDLPSAAWTPVTDAYFDTMGIQLRQGRLFGARDRVTAPAGAPVTFDVNASVAVVNESFARRFWPDGNAVGHRVKQGFPEYKGPWIEIVGVVNDVKAQGLDQPPPMQVYLPMSQRPVPFGSIVVRTSVDPELLRPALESAIHEVDGDLPVYDVRTLDEVIGESAGRQRLVAVLLFGFAGLAVILAGVGVFGVAAYGTSARVHEFGVRMALGAEPERVVRLVVGQELRACAIGIGLGLMGALGAAGLMRSMLYGVAPRDPLTLGVVTALLFAVSAVACYLPARRAARVDPAGVLRAAGE
jgi:putative ABC transport system permease protein